MNRTPPADVLRELRAEVGFGCPVEGCGNPYLYWHHFDPPWAEREHHEPAGMIALCGEHHAKADAGAFTLEQLRELKARGRQRANEVRGRFDWMRRDLLAVVGGNFYLDTPVIFKFRGEPAIWFNRDAEGYLLLNFRMLTLSGEPRVRVQDNFWLPRGNPDELECPPNGRKLRIGYRNGDELRIEFFEIPDPDAFARRYRDSADLGHELPLPVTAVEILQNVGGTDVSFSAKETRLPGNNVMRGCFFRKCSVAIAWS
jgi:hypothetical protein